MNNNLTSPTSLKQRWAMACCLKQLIDGLLGAFWVAAIVVSANVIVLGDRGTSETMDTCSSIGLQRLPSAHLAGQAARKSPFH